MTSYTKDSIEKLLDKYMSGTSTLDEEDLLARYFRESNVPEEWKDYQLLFQEIEAMKTNRPQKSPMLWWALAAAVVLGIIFVAVPKRLAEPITAQADTTTVRQELVPFIEQQIPAIEQETPAIEQETPATEKKSGTSTIEKENVRPMPKQKRSLRKSEPTIHDYAKAYALMAEAVQEQQEAEQKVAESRMTTLQAQLEALGYKSVRHEDGTIEYIDKNIHYTAYEE